MTKESAIKILEQYREKPTLINEIKTVEEAVWLNEAITMAIETLEQNTSFINKPCISIGVCHEDKIKMLDKISAEIEQLRNFRAENYDLEQYCDYFDARIIFRDEVLDIIDKYRKGDKE